MTLCCENVTVPHPSLVVDLALALTFRSLRYNTHQIYCYDHEPDNVEFESDHEIHIYTKGMNWYGGEW